MLFNSIDFILFFPAVVVLYYLIPHKLRYLWLLVCSYYFYMCWNPKYALLILFSTVITYASGILIEKVRNDSAEKTGNRGQRRAKMCVALSFSLNLAVLCYFKYFGFLINNLNHVLSELHITFKIPDFDILLPVGISFYIFQALSYTIDVYRNEVPAERNFLKYALFVSFFPQLVAGPIERSGNLLTQIHRQQKFRFRNFQEGSCLMVWGFVLKLVIADRIAMIVNLVYGNPAQYQGFYIVVATVLFAFQIYCDFNGYTMIARGCARMMGFELMENFRAPYYAGSVAEFWRRWHISLTSWFRDYLYIPLGGNRKGRERKFFNLMVVYAVSGLWHGAAWGYVLWGLLNGVYQIAGELLQPLRDWVVKVFSIDRTCVSHRILKVVTTFILVDFSWLFFRAASLGEAAKILKNLNCFNPQIFVDGSLYEVGGGKSSFLFLLCMLMGLLLLDFLKHKKTDVLGMVLYSGIWFRTLLLAVGTWMIIIFGIYGAEYEASQFIYFQF